MNKKAFTLIEVALAGALMAAVGLVVFATFSSGMRLWRRQNEGAPARSAAFFFERMQRDVENGCSFGAWSLIGNATQCEIPSCAGSLLVNDIRVSAPVRVLYVWMPEAQEVLRSTISLSEDLRGGSSSGRPVLTGAESFHLEYYFRDPETKIYSWSEQWPPEEIVLKEGVWPSAIKLTVALREGKNAYDAVKIFALPLGE